uniref:Uncharacterized protein n=1 Tax=Anopheles braziliensis TaxID=58242 RepID=A0A2M3ZLI6_9DIPT
MLRLVIFNFIELVVFVGRAAVVPMATMGTEEGWYDLGGKGMWGEVVAWRGGGVFVLVVIRGWIIAHCVALRDARANSRFFLSFFELSSTLPVSRDLKNLSHFCNGC